MNENTPTEIIDNDQSYIRLIRYLRKQQEGKRNEASNPKEVDSNKSE